MTGKFRIVIMAVSAIFLGSLMAATCGNNESEFRPSPEGEVASKDDKAAKKEQKATPKKDIRKKDETPAYNGPITTYSVNEETHDFGEVEKGSQNPFTFVLTNTGDHPLIIENAKGSCSCTVPKKPEDPIMPGETGEIEVTFKPKASQKGPVNQVVTITANTEPRQTKLKIKANVQQDEEEATAK